ncbi:MAG: histidine phosphatase family protein [Pseudomonadota bacterium]
MGEIFLVRHGQANSVATTEEEYDRLSDMGHQQARWLGDWFRENAHGFEHIVSGTMRRHRETVSGLGLTAEEDARLNEINYYALSDALHRVKGEPLPTGETFAVHMPKVFAAWKAAEIEGTESYFAFETRVAELLKDAIQPGRRVLCVTSGGVIGMILRHILDLDILKMSDVMLPIYNSSLHRLTVRDGVAYLAGFNAIPHLDPPDRAHARTHY